MSQISQSHLFNTNEINPFQAIAELIKSNGSDQSYQLDWQNNADRIELTLLDKVLDDNTTKLVVFGELTWNKLSDLQTDIESKSGVAIEAVRLSKPNEDLQGAVIFQLANKLTAEQSAFYQLWSEQNDLELCVLNNAPEISKPGLLVMDMDSTAIQIECIDEIAKLAGVGEQVAQVTAQAMRGELDFAESLRARVATLTDAPVSVIDQVADNLPLMPGLEHLVSVLKQKGWRIVVASGGFTYMTEVLKRDLSLDKTVANQLEMADGKLTGKVLGDIVDAQTKADTVVELANEWGISMSQTVAMGEGANDCTMMAAEN